MVFGVVVHQVSPVNAMKSCEQMTGETGGCHQYATAAPALLFSSGALQFLLPAALRVIQFGLVPQQEFLFWVSRSLSFSLFFFASPGCLSGVLSLSFSV